MHTCGRRARLPAPAAPPAALGVLAALVTLVLAAAAAAAPPAGAVLDTTPPGPPTISGPSGRVASTSATIAVKAADPSDIVTCHYNGEEINCPGTWTYTGLEQGPHSVTAQSQDAAGNISALVHLYWEVDTVGPVGTVVAPSSLATEAYVSFDENASGVSAASVRLATDAATPVPASRRCETNTREATPCGSDKVRRVYLTPDEGWVLGERYRVQVNPAGDATVADALGNVGAASTGAFQVQTAVQESALTYTWGRVNRAKASGGSYLVERRAGAALTWRFTGPTLRWVTVTGPAFGRADVYIDGSWRGTYSGYRPQVHFGVERSWSGLGSGPHTVEVRALGRKGAKAGLDTLVAVDAFVTADGRVASPVPERQAWQRSEATGASGGYLCTADLAGQRASIAFRGTAVTVTTAVGPRYGDVALYVDGTLQRTASLYAPTRQLGHELTVAGLSDSQHTLEVRVLGSGTGTGVGPGPGPGPGVAVDAISVP